MTRPIPTSESSGNVNTGHLIAVFNPGADAPLAYTVEDIVRSIFTTAQATKLEGIEANATTDQTGTQIRDKLAALTGNDRLRSLAIRDLITQITAGDGLTGGGSEGTVTLTVNPGTGIVVVSDQVRLDTPAAVRGYLGITPGHETATLPLLDHVALAQGGEVARYDANTEGKPAGSNFGIVIGDAGGVFIVGLDTQRHYWQAENTSWGGWSNTWDGRAVPGSATGAATALPADRTYFVDSPTAVTGIGTVPATGQFVLQKYSATEYGILQGNRMWSTSDTGATWTEGRTSRVLGSLSAMRGSLDAYILDGGAAQAPYGGSIAPTTRPLWGVSHSDTSDLIYAWAYDGGTKYYLRQVYSSRLVGSPQPVARDRGAWAASTAYIVGDIATRNSYVYRCKTANSDSAFTATKWDALYSPPTPTPSEDDNVYLFAQTSTATPTEIPSSAASGWPTVTMPQPAANSYLVVAQRSARNDLNSLLKDGVQQIGGLTKQSTTFTHNGNTYEWWITVLLFPETIVGTYTFGRSA